MPLQYQIVPVNDFGGGEDQKSAPSRLLAGYCETLLNAETNSAGWAGTRKGYQGYYGYVPLRCSYVSHSGTGIQFRVGASGSVDFGSLASTPIVVYGKVPAGDAPGGGYAGDFSTTNALRYYPYFSVDNRFALTAPSGTLSLTATDHAFDSYRMFIGLAASTSATDNSWLSVYPDSVAITQATLAASIGYTTPSNEDAFLFFQERQTTVGEVYVASATASTSEAITAATHNLDNFNILVKCYAVSGGVSTEVIPSAVTIGATGTVTVTFSSAFTGEIILSAAPSGNLYATTATAGANTLTITDVTSPWVFYSVYAYNSGTSTFDQVIPDAVNYDAAAEELEITYTLASGTESVEVYYDYGSTVSNRILVTDTGAVSEAYTSDAPQLTIWGIPHDGLYTDAASAGGHITHIDSYKRTDESRAICGLGGTIYAARTLDEVGDTYGMPALYANLRSRVSTDTNLAPLFQADGSAVSRTRGIVTDATITAGENLARVTAATYVSAGVIDYTLSFTSKTGNIDLTSVSITDYLTVSGLADPAYNGSFLISSVQSDTATQTVIRCANSGVFIADFDETGADGRAGVFTDKFAVTAAPTMLTGDVLLSSAIDEDLTVTVKSFASTTVTVDGITEAVPLPAGVLVGYQRETDVVPLRDLDLTSSATNLVRGDMLTVSDLDREVRVKFVNPDANNTISTITSTGTIATVTVAADHHLAVGQKALLVGTGVSVYDGEQTLLTAPTDRTFTFATTVATGSVIGTVVGYTAELDEGLTVMESTEDTTTFDVTGRWIPVEIPTTTFDLPVTTKTQLFDVNEFADQPLLQSTIIADTMFFLNGDDEVVKFDGDNVYQAGLIPWQPQLFAQVDTTTGSITIDTTTAASSAWAGNKFTVTEGESLGFSVGDRIQRSTELDLFTIMKITSDDSADYIYVDRAISGSTGARTLSKVARYRYYFRLNAIDANNNLVASAATGADDFVVEVAAACQIRMRLVGLPTFGVLDYDRLEVQVYRTTEVGSGSFYLVRTVPLSFDSGTGYIDILDGTPDELLRDFDGVHSGLAGAELGTAWHQPLRAKYVTSADNRLILTNLKDYPEINVTIRRKSSAVSLAPADLDLFRWLWRRDNTDTATTTNMVDRMAFEFVDSGAVTINPAADISRTATTFTITETAHGLVVGNWVYLFHAAEGADNDLHFAGWWQIASKTDDTFTINFDNDYTPSADDVNRYVAATAAADIPVWLGTDGNYNWLNGNTSSSYEFLAALRLANVINVVATMTDRSITGQEDFTPWLYARAGSEFAAGQLVVRQPVVESTTPELALPTIAADVPYSIFVNNVVRTSAEQISASSRLFPSRVAVSYRNFPEIFDDPYGASGDGDSVVDINAADGQEAVGAIPFFGDSSFGSGQVEGKVIVFKTNSIYQLDVATLQYQEIKQPYGGCTAPRSISHTKDGVVFANDSGMYRLNKNLSVVRIGEYEERRWRKDVNKAALARATGHNFKAGNKYKLSVPVGADQETNNYVFNYDYTREDDGKPGAWTRHDNFPATGWANLENESLFGTTDGQVFKMRSANDATDYRDDDAAITMTIVTRAEDFELPGVNKIVSGVLLEFHNDEDPVEGLTVSTAINLSTEFTEADELEVAESTRKQESGWFSVAQRKCQRIQTKIVSSQIDRPIVLAGMAYRVAALDAKGAPEAVNQ